MAKRFFTNVVGKMCAKDLNASHTWKLPTFPWGMIVAAMEKDDSVVITVKCPLTGRLAEMYLLHVILEPSKEYCNVQLEADRLAAMEKK